MKRLGFQSLAAIVLLVLLLPPVNAALQSSSTASKTTVEPAAAKHWPVPNGAQQEARSEAASPTHQRPSGPPKETIKVHGHWAITIRNADGSVASQHEFENSLITGGVLNGRAAIAAALTQAQAAPAWQVDVFLSPGCLLDLPYLTPQVANGAIVLSASNKNPCGKTVQITTVLTSVQITTQNGQLTSHYDFSSRDLTTPVPPATTAPPPINVLDGQTIDVTVTISFS